MRRILARGVRLEHDVTTTMREMRQVMKKKILSLKMIMRLFATRMILNFLTFNYES
jgi:hypothetical protein